MTRAEALLARLAALPSLDDKPEETPEATLRALWWTATGTPRSVDLAIEGELPALTGPQAEALDALIDRRLAGVPLAYLTGRQRFLGIEMLAAPGALIPRKETEILGRGALTVIHDAAQTRGAVTVIDVCTGSGNLALAYAAHEPRARVLASDLSAEAIAVARDNARLTGLSDRVDFREGDLLAPFGPDLDGAVDVLSCNPPYISTAKVKAMAAEIADHEPGLAFDGGPFGVRLLTRLINEAPRLVRPGGWICFEVGLGQGPAMGQRLEAHGAYQNVRRFVDASGAVRALAARVPEHGGRP